MARKNVLILSILSEKADSIDIVRKIIRSKGHDVTILDMGWEPAKEAGDIPSSEVARAGGWNVEEMRRSSDRPKIIDVMIKGAVVKARELLEKSQLDGIMSIGGGTNTLMGTSVFKALPFGIPKLAVSSTAGMPAYAHQYIGTSDTMLFHSVVDTNVMNSVLRNVLVRSAYAMCGLVESNVKPLNDEISALRKKGTTIIAMTELNVSELNTLLFEMLTTERGYEVITFHANGISDSVMEDLIESGVRFDAVLDTCVAGVSENLLGGNRPAKDTRLLAAGRAGIPQIITPCSLDMLSCGPLDRRDAGDSLWAKRGLAKRKLWIMDSQRVQAKISPEEAMEVANVIAKRLNDAKAVVKFLVPTRGWESVNREGEVLYEPETDRVLIETLKKKVDPKIVEIRDYDMYIDTREFAEVIVDTLDEILRSPRRA